MILNRISDGLGDISLKLFFKEGLCTAVVECCLQKTFNNKLLERFLASRACNTPTSNDKGNEGIEPSFPGQGDLKGHFSLGTSHLKLTLRPVTQLDFCLHLLPPLPCLFQVLIQRHSLINTPYIKLCLTENPPNFLQNLYHIS